jgi:hypothetical protein
VTAGAGGLTTKAGTKGRRDEGHRDEGCDERVSKLVSEQISGVRGRVGVGEQGSRCRSLGWLRVECH